MQTPTECLTEGETEVFTFLWPLSCDLVGSLCPLDRVIMQQGGRLIERLLLWLIRHKMKRQESRKRWMEESRKDWLRVKKANLLNDGRDV